MLARLHRAGELTPVYVPLADDEAMRDLTRAREDAKSDQKKCKQRLMAILLRNGHRYSGRTHWSQVHMRWLADIKMPHRAQQIVLQEYIDALTECRLRVERLTEQIRQLLPDWRMLPVVTALQSLRGVSLIVAVTTDCRDRGSFPFYTPLRMLIGLPGAWCRSGAFQRGKDQATVRSPKQINIARQPKGRNHGLENPRALYWIRPWAELTSLERGSSATKPSHAVTNPRISE